MTLQDDLFALRAAVADSKAKTLLLTGFIQQLQPLLASDPVASGILTQFDTSIGDAQVAEDLVVTDVEKVATSAQAIQVAPGNAPPAPPAPSGNFTPGATAAVGIGGAAAGLVAGWMMWGSRKRNPLSDAFGESRRRRRQRKRS